jgi:WD40 repeat protein
MAVSADGNLLVATSFDGAALIWDLSQKAAGKPLPKSESMRGVAFSPTENVLAAGSIKNTFSLWNLDSKNLFGKHKEVKIPKVAENSDVCSVSFSPDGSLLLTGHMDSSITLWNAKKRKQILNFYVPDASTFEVAFSPDGTLFATANANGRIYFWDPETSIELARLSGHQGAVKTIDFSPMENQLMASGGEDGNIVIWQ